jgi:hypothetical protein
MRGRKRSLLKGKWKTTETGWQKKHKHKVGKNECIAEGEKKQMRGKRPLIKGSLQISPILRLVPLRTYRHEEHGYRSPLTVMHPKRYGFEIEITAPLSKRGATMTLVEVMNRMLRWTKSKGTLLRSVHRVPSKRQGHDWCGSVIAQAPKVSLPSPSTNTKPRLDKVATRAN